MHYLLLALTLAVLTVVLASCRPAEKPAPSGTAAPAATAPLAPAPGSRADIAARLSALARDPAPTDLEMGAMCYKMAGPPDRAEYVCPACGQKTLYASSGDDNGLAAAVEDEIPACRRLLPEIQGLKVTLDESAFCEKCRAGAAAPRLALVVTWPDGRQHRTEGVGATDLRLLAEFSAGARKHVGERDVETPLKDHLPRLEALLGVEHATPPAR